MCCLFCLSFRGAAYFVSTTQILLGLGIVIKYSTSLPEIKISDNFLSGTIGVIFTYGLLIFMFGCCIFSGLEKEGLRVLKVSVGGFTFMQCLVIVTHLTLIALTFDELKEEERMMQVSILALNLLLTFLHLTILFLYMIGLARRQVTTKLSRSPETSESSLALSNSKSDHGGTLHRNHNQGGSHASRYSVGSCSVSMSSMAQRYVDGRWEDLHV